jgi:superoxide dismutase, Cu-Zn family
MKRNIYLAGSLAVLAFGIGACASYNEGSASRSPKAEASATLSPTKDSTVKGTVYFTKVTDGVRLDGEITGLTPGQHGFHVHEKGDCSAPDATSAGGHYNPTDMPHGDPMAALRHVGDFGNIDANASGVAKFSRTDHVIKLDGPNSIIGKSLIVHAKPDDLKTQQPPGNAGARVACGIIEASAKK